MKIFRLFSIVGIFALAFMAIAQGDTVSGRVIDQAGNGLPGIFVRAYDSGRNIGVIVVTDADGNYSIPDLPEATYQVEAFQTGYNSGINFAPAGGTVDFTLRPAADIAAQVSASMWLDALPAGDQRQHFIMECAGCHQVNYIYRKYGRWLTRDQWASGINLMLGFYHPRSSFPILPDLDPDALADYLSATLNPDAEILLETPPVIEGEAAQAVITEYDFPGAGPHDLMRLSDGRIVVTGMFSHDLWVLTPETGEFEQIPLPNGSNPRAIDQDANGNWWIVFGSPEQVARYEPETGELERYYVGIYAHSIAIDSQGRAWVNGHFTTDPVEVAMIDPTTDEITFYDVPTDNSTFDEGEPPSGLPISYELRAAPDDSIWIGDLRWNRVYRLDPVTGGVDFYELPQPLSAPRRFDIDSDGILWIPEFSGGRLARLDPASGEFTEYELPTSNSAPYVARVDDARNRLWIANAASDSVIAFDMEAETMVEYRLPTRGALVRHIVVDPTNGDLWLSYHHVPTISDRVVRLRPNGGE